MATTATETKTVSERAADKERGRTWFCELPDDAKWDLGDALVLGYFNWVDYGFSRKPSPSFMAGVEEAREAWETVS